MTKLHELLPVVVDKEKAAKKMGTEGCVTFKKKTGHFQARHRKLQMTEEGHGDEEKALEEIDHLVTTVPDKLEYIAESQVKWIDLCLEIEKTNQVATADLKIGNTVLGTNLPATFLLGLETKLKQFRTIVEAVPTLDPTTEWVKDTDAGKHIYRSTNPVRHSKTKKIRVSKIIVPATDHHPAQVDVWTEDTIVGVFTTNLKSGMITPGEKSDILERLDMLVQAAKQARQRANATEVVKDKIAQKLFDHVLRF